MGQNISREADRPTSGKEIPRLLAKRAKVQHWFLKESTIRPYSVDILTSYFFNIAACRAVTMQRPRDKQIFQNHF
jgi:hypothetical protein